MITLSNLEAKARDSQVCIPILPSTILALIADLRAARQFLEETSQPKESLEKLEEESTLDPECSQGNGDDQFRDGMTKADACNALDAREVLDALNVKP